MTINDFHFYVGESIMRCQTIENDIKWIYSGMHKGKHTITFDKISKWTLGETLSELKKMDNEDGNPYFSMKDYSFLSDLTKKRNELVHSSYKEFVYNKKYESSQEYIDLCNWLKGFRDELEVFSTHIEAIRLDVLRRYSRI